MLVADTLQSVHQALRILSLLRARRNELGVTEIATELGIGTSSTYRLLSTLKEDRYVDQTPTRGYRLGPAMSGSADADSVGHCAEVAAPHLSDLRDRTGETVHISILNAGYTEFVAVCESERSLRVTSKIGFAVQAYAAAAGKVLLATLTESELDALYPDDTLLTPTGRGVRTRSDLNAQLKLVRECGYARNVEESEEGLYALAVAIHRPVGRPITTLTITGPASRIAPGAGSTLSARETELLGELRATTQRIESELRY
ncbi:hypothetical protein AXA44_23875 [Rhodococcus sp. SC4]|nr:hypothetical protein AXA44_23875 [Rhodococcus sp. SC4]